jgi:hypothetical protein
MDIKEKLELNKLIRAYQGDNSFILSLQKHLKNNKYLEKVQVGNKMIKILSDKQYNAASDTLK